MGSRKKFSGGCACGKVRYVANGPPSLMVNCHCRDCQRASGSAFAGIVVVPAEGVELRGDLSYHLTAGDRGKAVDRGFCPSCGNPVLVKMEAHPGVAGLLAGGLDDPGMHAPTADIFTGSAHAWDIMAPGTRKFERNLGR